MAIKLSSQSNIEFIDTDRKHTTMVHGSSTLGIFGLFFQYSGRTTYKNLKPHILRTMSADKMSQHDPVIQDKGNRIIYIFGICFAFLDLSFNFLLIFHGFFSVFS